MTPTNPAQAVREALKPTVAHAINELCDLGCNGIQWLRNIRDGISTADEGLKEMEENYERCLGIARAALASPVPDAVPEPDELTFDLMGLQSVIKAGDLVNRPKAVEIVGRALAELSRLSALVKAQKPDIASPAGENEKWRICSVCGDIHDKPSPSPAPGETGELVDLLTQIANHDWRISMLAHTSDTAKRAAALITSIERMREGLRGDAAIFENIGYDTRCAFVRELAGNSG